MLLDQRGRHSGVGSGNSHGNPLAALMGASMYRVFCQRIADGFLSGKIFLMGKYHSEEEARRAALQGNGKAFTPFYYWVEKQ